MEKKKRLILIALLCFRLLSVTAQTTKLDSLENKVNRYKPNDTTKVNLYVEIAIEALSNQPEKTLQYARLSGDLSTKIDYTKGEAESNWLLGLYNEKLDKKLALEFFLKAYKLAETSNNELLQAKYLNSLGLIYRGLGEKDKAIDCMQRAVKISGEMDDRLAQAKYLIDLASYNGANGSTNKALTDLQYCLKTIIEFNDEPSLAKCYSQLGVIHFSLANRPISLDYLLKALKLYEKLNNQPEIIRILINLSAIYRHQLEFNASLEVLLRAAKMAEDLNDMQWIPICYEKLGVTYMKLNNPEAITYLNKSLKIAQQLEDKYKIMNANESIGDFYFQQKKYKNAITAYEKALQMAQEVERQRSVSDIWRKMGKAFLKLNETDKALDFTQKSLAIAKEYKMLNEQKLIHFQLSQIDSANNNFKQAYDNYKRYKEISDSIFNEKNVKKIAELELNYKFEKEKQAIAFENLKKESAFKAKQKIQQIIIASLIISIILISIIAGTLYKLYHYKHKTTMVLLSQKKEIEELNDEYIAVNEELKQSNEQLYATKLKVEERENLLNQITDNIPVLVSLVNTNLEYTFANKSYADAFNLQKEEILGKKICNVLDYNCLQNSENNLNLPLAGKSVTFENSINTPDKKPIPVQTTYLPYYENGEITGILVCSTDITQRKEAEQLIKNSEEKLSLIIKNSNDIFVMVNEKGEQFFISDVAERFTGYSINELKGAIKDVIYFEDVEKIQKHWSNVIQNPNLADTVQYRHKHKEKGYIWFEAVAQNYLDNPIINAVVANIRDITERKKIEQALEIAEAEKKQLLQAEINRINDELENNQKAMAVATLRLIQNSERDAETIEKLNQIERNTNAEGKKQINAIIANYKRVSFNSNWEEFELLFQKTHRSFYENLNAKFPNLTANERKMCAFLKLNMSSKDIAQITFQSEDALKKARLRLRQKLDIERDTNLIAFLQNI